MNCPRCQRDAPLDAAFCPKCGAKLSVACPQCGVATAPDDNFCRKCGARVTVPTAAAATRFAAPQSYTPTYLAEEAEDPGLVATFFLPVREVEGAPGGRHRVVAASG